MPATTIIILLAAVVIGFNIWNTLNLRSLSRRPLRNDSLNDQKYWELKYKMQYMITSFTVIVFAVGYLGFSTLQNAKENMRAEFQARLDSSKRTLEIIEMKQRELDQKISNTDSSILQAESAILGLIDREKFLKGSLSLRHVDLEKLKSRITEINSKNIIQQNIYIVDDVEYTFSEYWDFKKYYFKDLVSNTGQPLPIFRKPPFIFPVSNQGMSFSIRKVTTESFEMTLSMAANTDMNDVKVFKATLFITETE